MEPVSSILSPPLKRALAERGISELNAFQVAAIPIIAKGKDALLIAPTAGGKTEAALLPLLEMAAKSQGRGIRLIYVAPLRALLNDIQPRIKDYANSVGLRAFKWHGDVSAREKRQAEKHPPDVLLITPESIEVILVGRRSPQALFGQLQAVLIDEVHYFAASGRGAHLLALVSRLEKIAGREMQRVGLSATVGNPEQILQWLARPDREGCPVTPAGEARGKRRIWDVIAARQDQVARTLLPMIARPIATSDGAEKKAPRSIIFCRSRKGTEDISRDLERESQRYPGIRFEYGVHHSSVGKDWREKAEREIKLRDATSRTVLATSSLELGIDLGDLDLVGQAGPMSRVASFLQRVGRAGRRPGKPQWFVSVNVRPERRDREENASWTFLKNLAILNLGAHGKIEDVEPVPKAFHVLAQQILATCVSRHGFQKERDLPTLLRAAPFADITSTEADELLDHMVTNDFLRSVPPNLVIGRQAEKRYLRFNGLPLFSVFDTPHDFTVVDGKTEVGIVDAIYVLGQDIPFDLRLAGRNWRATDVSVERGIVKVTPTKRGTPPHWMSTGPGTSRIVVEEMARILKGASLADHINLDDRAYEWLTELQKISMLPLHEPQRIVVRPLGHARCRVEALGGDRVMRTLALWLEAAEGLQIKNLGPACFSVERDAESDRHLSVEEIQRLLRRAVDVDPETVLNVIARMIEDDETFNKFAPCVPSPLRKLHVAATVADPSEVKSFRVDDED